MMRKSEYALWALLAVAVIAAGSTVVSMARSPSAAAANSEIYAERMMREHHSYLHYLRKRDGKGLAEEVKNNLTQHLEEMTKKSNR